MVMVTGGDQVDRWAVRALRARRIRFLLAGCAALLLCALLIAPPDGGAVRAETTVPADFLGLHVNGAAPQNLTGHPAVPIPDLGEQGIRLQDAGTAWRNLNPAPGTFDWRLLDARVELNEAQHRTTMLVLGAPPKWVADVWLHSDRPDREQFLYKAWTDYVTAVAGRYGDRIAYYELWNEPDVGGFNGGTLEQLLQLTRLAYPILKQAAPHSKVISPAFSMPGPSFSADPHARLSPSLRNFVAAGGGRSVDLISIHAYPGDGAQPETLIPRLQLVRLIVDGAGLSGMPIIDSESGARGWRDAQGKIHNIPPNFGEPLPTAPVDLQSAYVARTLMVIAASGVVRKSYYFTFDNGDNARSGRSVMAIVMTGASPGAPVRRPALAYRNLARLLPGARLGAVRRVGGHWELDILTAQGLQATAYWCSDYHQDEISLAPSARITDVAGAPLPHPVGPLTIDASPVFVFDR